MQAAVGVHSFSSGRVLEKRQHNADGCCAVSLSFGNILFCPEATPGSEPSWFGLPLTVRDGAPFSRDELVRHLNARRIGTRFLFGGNLVHQPYMRGREYRVAGDLGNADIVMNRTFWVGVYPVWTMPISIICSK